MIGQIFVCNNDANNEIKDEGAADNDSSDSDYVIDYTDDDYVFF